MQVPRRDVLTGSLILAMTATAGRHAAAASKPTITVQKSPT
jgi:hypothetical protein